MVVIYWQINIHIDMYLTAFSFTYIRMNVFFVLNKVIPIEGEVF